MKFSERKGFTKVKDVLQIDSMNDDLRNSIWNSIHSYLIYNRYQNDHAKKRHHAHMVARKFWSDFYKLPADNLSLHKAYEAINSIKTRFFESEWFEVYDLIEFVLSTQWAGPNWVKELNLIFERENSGYRIIDNKIIDIIDDLEIAEIEQAMSIDNYEGISKQISTALSHIANREKPDYRNSIKESISAVEGILQIYAGDTNATLGQALKQLGETSEIHPLFEEALRKLYSYTNNEDGLRHALIEDKNIGHAEAKYFLVVCSAYVNYIKAKI